MVTESTMVTNHCRLFNSGADLFVPAAVTIPLINTVGGMDGECRCCHQYVGVLMRPISGLPPSSKLRTAVVVMYSFVDGSRMPSHVLHFIVSDRRLLAQRVSNKARLTVAGSVWSPMWPARRIGLVLIQHRSWHLDVGTRWTQHDVG